MVPCLCMKKTKGVAFVTVLIIISVSAGIFATIMYFTLSGTEISSIQRKYQSSKEASIGAIDVMTKDILPNVIIGTDLSAVVNLLSKPGIVPVIQADSANDVCFRTKLTSLTGSWGTCDSNPDPRINSDIIIHLKSVTAPNSRPFVVSMKIVDTVPGNTDRSGIVLENAAGVVEGASGSIPVQHFPFLYTMMTDARPQGSTTERANIEVLYAY